MPTTHRRTSMLYAIVWSPTAWRIVRNKRQALQIAKRSMIGPAAVWSHPDVPEIRSSDWPTFVIGATRIYPPAQ